MYIYASEMFFSEADHNTTQLFSDHFESCKYFSVLNEDCLMWTMSIIVCSYLQMLILNSVLTQWLKMKDKLEVLKTFGIFHRNNVKVKTRYVKRFPLCNQPHAFRIFFRALFYYYSDEENLIQMTSNDVKDIF